MEVAGSPEAKRPGASKASGGWLVQRYRSWVFLLTTSVEFTLLVLLHTFASLAVLQHFFFKKWEQVDLTLPKAVPVRFPLPLPPPP